MLHKLETFLIYELEFTNIFLSVVIEYYFVIHIAT